MPLETSWDYTGRGCSITDFMDKFHTPCNGSWKVWVRERHINIYICKRILYPDLTVFARNMFLGSLLPNVAVWQPIILSSCTWGQRNDSKDILYMQLPGMIFVLRFAFSSDPSQRNTFQGIVITNGSTSYTVFTYECGDINWGDQATIGFKATGSFYRNHLYTASRAASIDCVNSPNSQWNNVVYRLNGNC